MSGDFSRTTIAEYLPVIRKMLAVIEIGNTSHPDPDRLQHLNMLFLKDECEGSTYVHAMDIVAVWLNGTPFRADFGAIYKEQQVSWSELIGLLRRKLMELNNEAPVIVLTFSESGTMSRTENGSTMSSEFFSDSQPAAFIRYLRKQNDYVPTQVLCDEIKCSGLDALNTIKDRLNKKLAQDLQLPATHDFIEGKRGVGYRINPIYNVVLK